PAKPKPKTIEQLANEVIAGKHGTGDARKKALGSQYNAVQKRVNEILGAGKSKKSVDQIAREVIDGKWGNDPQRSQKLRNAGYDSNAVQKRVNQILGAKTTNKPKGIKVGDTVTTRALYAN